MKEKNLSNYIKRLLILGGIFGVGTIVCAFLIGPIADRFPPVSEKIVRRLL